MKNRNLRKKLLSLASLAPYYLNAGYNILPKESALPGVEQPPLPKGGVPVKAVPVKAVPAEAVPVVQTVPAGKPLVQAGPPRMVSVPIMRVLPSVPSPPKAIVQPSVIAPSPSYHNRVYVITSSRSAHGKPKTTIYYIPRYNNGPFYWQWPDGMTYKYLPASL